MVGLVLLAVATATGAAGEPPRTLSFRTVGFYGVHLDVGDFAFLKFYYTKPADKGRIATYNRMLERAHAAGKINLVGLYTFDRVTHKRPIAEYLTNTDALLSGLRRDLIYAVCPSEENVTWNNGLRILNALYDRITSRWKLQCYQWLTVPAPPHGKLKADGWVLDAYGFDYERFRRHIAKFVVTGKPVVVCVNATSPRAKSAAERVGPWEPGSAAEAQMQICREFNLPVFFYAVDRHWGNVHAWLRDTDPLTVRCRRWALGWIARAHAERVGGLPLPTADYLAGRVWEVCGGRDLDFELGWDFADTGFLDFAGVEGLMALRWDGQTERLVVQGAGRPRRVRLQWHLTSPLKMKGVGARLSARLEGQGSRVQLAVGSSLIRWWSAEKRSSGKFGRYELSAALPEDWQGHEAWVAVQMDAAAGGTVVLDELAITGRSLRPQTKTITLHPGPERAVLYRDDCRTPKLIHFAEVDRPEELQWRPGQWYITGAEGRANRVKVALHFVCEKPLADGEVRIDCLAWTRAHGARIVAGLSADGRQMLVRRDTAELPQDERYKRFSGVMTLPLAEADRLREAKEFWVLIELVNASGVRAGASNVLRGLEVIGRMGK